jgi:hypothetical protein
MNKNVTGVIVVVVVAAGAYFVWRKMTSKKRNAMTVFTASAGRDLSKILSFDEGYVKSWAKAIKTGASTFVFNGVTYSKETGTTVK